MMGPGPEAGKGPGLRVGGGGGGTYGGGVGPQLTATSVTFAPPTVPAPLVTVQVCPDGEATTWTA